MRSVPKYSESGNFVIGASLALATASMAITLVVGITKDFSNRSSAQSAADAAAMAGSMHGPAAAAQLASENGGRLLSHQGNQGDFTAEVEVGESTARARAQTR